jgi:hypothetical protein
MQVCNQKFPDWVDNEINKKNKHSLRSNTKGYGDTTHCTDSATSGRELYHLQFSLQEASPETSGYTLVYPASYSVGKATRGVKLTTHFLLVPRLKMHGAIHRLLI